jgi:hypothetical protein
VARALRGAEPAVQSEVSASRRAWGLISTGLPQTPSPALRTAVAAADERAGALVEPRFVASARTLTGPAAGIGGIYESYERLARQGWRMTDAAVSAIASVPATGVGNTPAKSGTQARGGAAPAQASFARENSPLYIGAIYDGHFDLSLLGKSLLSGYERLGGATAFGRALTQGEINALAAAYSIPAVRLEPHPSGAAKEG